jgi:hypothetical protein
MKIRYNKLRKNPARNRKHSNPKPPPPEQYHTWGGFCRIKSTLPTAGKTDIHDICRFCLLARDLPDAITRLSRAGLNDFAFLTVSNSQVEIQITNSIAVANISTLTIGRHPADDNVNVFIASITDCYTRPGAYSHYTRVDAPDPLARVIAGHAIDAKQQIELRLCGGTTTITPHTLGLLETLAVSIGNLLSKPGDGGKAGGKS